MKIKAVGISGSPVKNGNVETFLKTMMDTVDMPELETEIVYLSRIDIKECKHCNFCIKKQTKEKYCSQKDEAQDIFNKLEAADIIILGSPVYFMRTSAKMAAMIDRLRVFIFGNQASGKLKNKIGVSAAVAWARHGGFETTHLSHLLTFLTLEMIPTSVHHCISPLGASAVASKDGTGMFDKDIRLGVDLDQAGIHSAKAFMNRAIEMVNLTQS